MEKCFKKIELLAAHRILKSINNTYMKSHGKNAAPSYLWLDFKHVEKSNPLFSNKTLRDAAFMLKQNEHADILFILAGSPQRAMSKGREPAT